MQQAAVSNPNDYKVVSFHNSTEFGFTPEMGCMYDGRPVNGLSGVGIASGETMILPFHIGRQLSINLAKRVLNTSPSATVDQAGVPTGVPIWSDAKLQELANTFIKDYYTEEKPIVQSETDKLMAKVEELRKFVGMDKESIQEEQKSSSNVYQDKAEVIAELEKRGIQHDKRKNKAELEKLLA